MSGPKRRAVLRGGVGLSALASGVIAAPAVNAQGGKPHAGTTITGSCFQPTYFEYLKNYFPQFEERTGIKVKFNMQAFPVYNQRTDLELSTKGSALDVINCTFIYSGRWIGAGWMTSLDTFTKDAKYTPASWEPEDFAGGPQSAMKNAKGYDGGTELSGGQWQRVALARALCAVRRGAGVVLLDEPTAQLDVRGEAEIFERILAATRHCTTILISHRFSTVRHADRICVLEQGRVIELGTHDELMAKRGRYRTMFDLQAQRFTAGEVEEGTTYDVLA